MRILIVEDEPLLAQRLERFCREILGDRLESVRVATMFAEASARLDESPIDLLLLDLNLHGRDGMQLLATSVAGSFHTIIVSAEHRIGNDSYQFARRRRMLVGRAHRQEGSHRRYSCDFISLY